MRMERKRWKKSISFPDFRKTIPSRNPSFLLLYSSFFFQTHFVILLFSFPFFSLPLSLILSFSSSFSSSHYQVIWTQVLFLIKKGCFFFLWFIFFQKFLLSFASFFSLSLFQMISILGAFLSFWEVMLSLK